MHVTCSILLRIAAAGAVSILLAACAPFPIDSGTLNPSDLDGSSTESDEDDSTGSTHPTETPMPESNPWVRIVSPSHNDTVTNPVTFVVEALDVHRLRLEADGWLIANWTPDAFSTSQTYSFSTTDTPRTIELIGEDAAGNPVAVEFITITPSNPVSDTPISTGQSSSILSVPYFYQYDNANEPGSTCGITSAAMLVNYWFPDHATPDGFYQDYGKPQGQSPGGLAQLYRWEGLYSTHTYGASRDDIRGHIDAGRPVVVHGNWTGAGHVAVIIGYDGSGWLANDPAGDWDTCYGCGWGAGVHYAFGGGWDEALSYDGDIWLSVASPTPL